MAREIVRNRDRRLLRLGSHSNHLAAVTQVFEVALGLQQPETSPDLDWLREVVGLFNRKRNTTIEYSHEDYGYWFTYSALEDLESLEFLNDSM